MQSLFVLCSTIYLCIYACEGPIRLFLHQHGADDLILLRDGLIFVPLVLLFVAQAFRGRIHPAYLVFAVLIGLHGAIIYASQRTYVPVVYGIKIYANLLFGFIAARQLCNPGRRTMLLLSVVWLVSIGALILDKYVTTMPWVGLEANIGGIQVDVARDWFVQGADKRAGGLMRSSIFAAALMPVLTFLLASRVRGFVLRSAILFAGLFAVFLTTQKGAVLAMAGVTAALTISNLPYRQYWLLRATALGFAAMAVGLPIFTTGLLVNVDNAGTFSVSSLLMRIGSTWPDAWHWISLNQIFPFGVGLGGIGGPQRFYAKDWTNPADNLFVYMYANFGLMTFVYLAWALRQMFVPRQLWVAAIVPLSILGFELGDGMVLSLLEDQVAALFVGASLGMLWQMHQEARGGVWADAYRGGLPAGPLEPAPIGFARAPDSDLITQ